LPWRRCNYDTAGWNEITCVSRSSGAYETYSFSLFVIRTSGSLPRRPMRMSLAKSEEQRAVDEKPCGGRENVEKNWRIERHARERVWRAAGGGRT